jgi:hypothetical protein
MIAAGFLDDLNATLVGRATLLINNPSVPPQNRPINIGLLFLHWEHTTWLVTSFPPIVTPPFPVPTPGGTNTTTVTLVGAGGGQFVPSTGAMNAALSLNFGESDTLIDDDTAAFVLDTWTGPGSPLDAAGNIRLFGTAPFQGGTLASQGNSGTLVVTGVISPHP